MYQNTPWIHYSRLANSLFILFLTATMITSCSDSKQAKQEGKNEAGKKDDSTTDKTKDVDYTAISTDICDCVTDAENSLGSTFKKLIINASKSENPETAIQTEMLQITDSIDQQKLMEEFKSYKSFRIESCMKNIEKNYPALNRNDKSQQQKLLDALEENCSEFSAAIMRMGMR